MRGQEPSLHLNAHRSNEFSGRLQTDRTVVSDRASAGNQLFIVCTPILSYRQ